MCTHTINTYMYAKKEEYAYMYMYIHSLYKYDEARKSICTCVYVAMYKIYTLDIYSTIYMYIDIDNTV